MVNDPTYLCEGIWRFTQTPKPVRKKGVGKASPAVLDAVSPSTTKATSRKNHNIVRYSKDRYTELQWYKSSGLIDSNADLAYKMKFSRLKEDEIKIRAFFYRDDGHKHAVAVLFITPRSDITLIDVEGVCTPTLGTQLIGSGDETRQAFKTHAILDVPKVRPSIKKVENVFCASRDRLVVSSSKLRAKQASPKHVSADVRRQHVSDEKKQEDAKMEQWVTNERSKKKQQCPTVVEKENCALTSSKYPTIDVGTPADEPDATLIRRAVTPKRKWSTFSFAGLWITASTSKHGDVSHVDVSSPTDVAPPALLDIQYPYAHYTREEWVTMENCTAENYGQVQKGDWRVAATHTLDVKTLKQLRDEDKRHIGTLKSQHAWNKRMAVFAQIN